MKEKIKKVLDEKKLNEKTPKYGKRKLKIGLVSCLLAFTLSIPITFAKENKPSEVTHTITVTDELQKAKADALETLDDNGIKDNESISKINACNSIEQVRKTKKEIIKKHREENRKKQEKEEQERIKEEQRNKEREDILAELATGDKGVKLKETLGEEGAKEFYKKIEEKFNTDPTFTAQKAKSYLEKPELLKKDDELKEAKEKAKKELKENGIDTEFFLKRIDSASKKELVEELTKQIISSHELQKAKEKAIRELDEYPEAFATLHSLADEAKKAKIKEINEASKEEEVKKILDKVKIAHNLNKAKKEGEAFLDKLTFKDTTQKSEANRKIKNARAIEEVLNVSKTELKKALDGYSDVFSKKLYSEDFVKALKTQEEQEIDKINSLEELNKKLDTIENANKIAKAKEEAKEKVKDMKELSFEEKTEAYNAIGSGSTLEEVNAEIKKAQEKESLKKAKDDAIDRLDDYGIKDNESISKINSCNSVEQVNKVKKELIEKRKQENRKKQEKEEQERIKEEQRKKELEDVLAELATGDKGLELEKALGKEKIEKLFNEIKQGLNNPEYTKEKAKKALEALETKLNELKEVKKEAKEELRKEGITSKLFLDKIDLAKTKEGVDALKAEIIKSHKEEVLKKIKEEAKKHVDLKNLPDKVKELAKKDIDNAITVDDVKDIVSRVDVMDRKVSEKSLKEAKKEAKEELRKEGVTSKLFLDKIDLAKTKEGVDALKTEIIKSHKEEVLKKTKELEALKAKLEALKTKLKELKAKKLKKSNSVDTFKSGYMMDRTPFMLFALSTSNENNVENLQNEINGTKNQIEDLEKQIKDLEKQIEDLTKEDPAPVPNPNPVPNPMPNPNPAPNPAPEADKEAEKKAKELQETKEKAIAELKEASIEDKESIAKINACKSVEEVNKVKEDLLNEKKAKELQEAKEKAIAELKEASIEDKESIAKINACKSTEEVNKVKEDLLNEKKAKELQEAKEKAIAELKEASIEDEESTSKINACKSIEEVNEVKEDLLKQKKGIVVKKKKQNTPNTSIAGASLATTVVSLAGAIMIKRKRR